MAIENGIQVDRRVAIAMDALSPGQKAALTPVLQSKDLFLAYAKKPGTTRKLSESKALYAMKAGSGMRIVFEAQKDGIVVRDLMQKSTLDRYIAKRKSKSAKKTVAKRDEARKLRKV
jgi:hypothetical protein